jgi:hypothetical protein
MVHANCEPAAGGTRFHNSSSAAARPTSKELNRAKSTVVRQSPKWILTRLFQLGQFDAVQ